MKSVWDTSLGVVPIEAPTILSRSDESTAAVGSFFSGVVDSCYTLQKHRGEITHLIFVHGFDIPLHRHALREHVAGELRQMARALNLKMIEVETNLREHSDRYVSWDDYHGSAMAAVAHFISPCFGKIYFPSSYAYAFLFPHGSHPGLDPLWGTESLEIVHDGCEANRFEKIQALVGWEMAVRNLRVCWQLAEGELNCGQCTKCLWTMAFLRACGALEQAASFKQPLNLDALRQHPPTRPDEYARFVCALAAVERRGNDPELAECLREGLVRARTARSAELWAGKWTRRMARFWMGKRS